LGLAVLALAALLVGATADAPSVGGGSAEAAGKTKGGKCKGGKGKGKGAATGSAAKGRDGRGRGKRCGGRGRGDAGKNPGGDTDPEPPAGDSDGAMGDQPIVAGPAAQSAGYLTKTATTGVGGPLSFYNFDYVQHDVRSVESAPEGGPLFSSELAGPGQSVPIAGLDRVSSGATYEFLCSIHPGMRGSLKIR
jgi:plastocyanin